jgi:outer membrane protein assembly factor BamB
VLWRKTIGTGYAGPAVAGDFVFFMDRERPVDKDGKPARPTRQGIPGKERIWCLSTKDGETVWKKEYECPYKVSYPNGPRTTPLVHQGKVYTLGAMGDFMCLDAKKGDILWSKNLMKEYKLEDPPVWGWATHPLIEGDLLYCLVGGDNAIVAFNKDTGKEAWHALKTAEIGYSPPMIYEIGGKKQLLVWLSESVNGLNPATGEALWSVPYPSNGKLIRPAAQRAQGARGAGDPGPCC